MKTLREFIEREVKTLREFILSLLLLLMAGSQIKAPPVFNEEEDYLNWKNDLEVWKLFTDTEKRKMSPAVYLTLTGRAREAVRDLKTSGYWKRNWIR